jgi:surfeit locus 1 family protein
MEEDTRPQADRGRSTLRKRLLRWGFVGIVVVATALFTRLGFWQLHRLSERKAENAARRARQARPPLALPGGVALARLPLARPGGADSASTARSDSLAWRSARLVGRFDWRREVVLRDRSFQGAPGVYVVTPLVVREDGDSVGIPVLRGWLPAADAFHAPLAAGRPDSAGLPGAGGRGRGARGGVRTPEGARTEEGAAGSMAPDTVDVLLLRVPGARARRIDSLKAPDGYHPVLGHLDPRALARLIPYPVAQLYAQRTDSAGSRVFPVRVALPELTNGPHLSYAIQWFAFAVISVVGGVIFWRRGGVV